MDVFTRTRLDGQLLPLLLRPDMQPTEKRTGSYLNERIDLGRRHAFGRPSIVPNTVAMDHFHRSLHESGGKFPSDRAHVDLHEPHRSMARSSGSPSWNPPAL